MHSRGEKRVSAARTAVSNRGEQPDITLSELRHRLAGRKVKVSIAAIFRFLRHLKLTLKKSPARG